MTGWWPNPASSPPGAVPIERARPRRAHERHVRPGSDLDCAQPPPEPRSPRRCARDQVTAAPASSPPGAVPTEQTSSLRATKSPSVAVRTSAGRVRNPGLPSSTPHAICRETLRNYRSPTASRLHVVAPACGRRRPRKRSTKPKPPSASPTGAASVEEPVASVARGARTMLTAGRRRSPANTSRTSPSGCTQVCRTCATRSSSPSCCPSYARARSASSSGSWNSASKGITSIS